MNIDMGAATAEPTAGAPMAVMPNAFGAPAGPAILHEDRDQGRAASRLKEVPGGAGEAASSAGEVISPAALGVCQAAQQVATRPPATSPPVTVRCPAGLHLLLEALQLARLPL